MHKRWIVLPLLALMLLGACASGGSADMMLTNGQEELKSQMGLNQTYFDKLFSGDSQSAGEEPAFTAAQTTAAAIGYAESDSPRPQTA